MLTSTFCHIPGIGPKNEATIWEAGARSWSDCVDLELPFNERKRRKIARHLEQSQSELEGGNIGFFKETMPEGESWRLFPEFRGRTAYLDIETTGLGPTFGDHITTIALWDGKEVKHYVYGENLRDFKQEIMEYDLLVTYNGSCFDLPFIENYFLMKLPQAHVDLRFLLADLGFSGGLKGCERAMGLNRGELDGVDGYFAVLLWKEYATSGDRRALDTLLSYNVLDTVVLEQMMVRAYNLRLEQTPFLDSHQIATPQDPPNPFIADRDMIGMIRRRIRRGGR